jgi:hypothetical protein
MIEKVGNCYYVTGELDYLSYTVFYEVIFEIDDGSTFKDPNSFFRHRAEIKEIFRDDVKVKNIAKKFILDKITTQINTKAFSEFENYCNIRYEIIQESAFY